MEKIKKDPEKHQSRIEIRRCFLNTDNCRLSFIREYWSSKYKIFYFYLKLNEKSLYKYKNRSIQIIKSKPIDHLTENKNFTNQFLDLLVKHSLFPVSLTDNANLKSEFHKKTIISNLCILFWFWLIITIFSIFFFHTILFLLASSLIYFTTILFSYICYFYLFAYLRSNTNAASLYNIISIVVLYLIILNDSLIVTICYSQSRKQAASSKVSLAEKSKRITINTFRQSFYYIVPKNMAFIFILFVSYLNQIEIIQKFCLFLIILIIGYMILGFSLYSIAILFLSNYHHKFWYKHQIKIFDVDLNHFIKKIFSDQMPFLVTRFSFFWIIFYTCLAVLSLFIVFYHPKFSLDKQFVSFKKKTDLEISIIWGSMVQHYRQDINSLMSIEMELHAFEQFEQITKLCENFKNSKQPEWIRKANCFSLSLNEFFLNVTGRKNLDQIDMLIDVETRLMDVNFNKLETICKPKVFHMTENLFNKCIKWWSLKVLEYELNQNKTFITSPVFLSNRLVPSLYFIQIETNLEIKRLEYENVQLIVNSIESWWKNLAQQFKLNENFVWWTSEQLENYYFQKKANQQILLTTLVSLIIILAISIYSCSKLITSLCVYVTTVFSLLTISALLICLDFKINLYNINLFILQIILAAQYSLFKGVSLRYSPHVDQQNCIIWSFSNVGLSILVYWLLSCLGSLSLVFSSVKFYSSLGKVILLSNVVSYWYSILFLPSLLTLSSKDIFQDLLAKLKVNKRNNSRHRFPFGRQTSTSSFAPSIVYSHARTISTYLDSDLTDVGEYRRRTLSRCSTGFNSHKNSITGWYSNEGRSSLSNQNPNYLQIPRVSRSSVRRISNQSRRSSMVRSRRHSNLMTRRNSKKIPKQKSN